MSRLDFFSLNWTELASWDNDWSFIEAVATWSDYVCSGADPSAPLFAAEGAFHLANQRVTRRRIAAYIDLIT